MSTASALDLKKRKIPLIDDAEWLFLLRAFPRQAPRFRSGFELSGKMIC